MAYRKETLGGYSSFEFSDNFLGIRMDATIPKEKIARLHKRGTSNRILKAAYQAGAKVVARTAGMRNYGFNDRNLVARRKTSKVLRNDDHWSRIERENNYNWDSRKALISKLERGLRKSIKVVSKTYKGRPDVFVVANHPIAYVIEYGHGGPKPAPPYPFLSRAAKEKSGAIMAAMRSVLPGAIKKELDRKPTGYRRPPSRFGAKR